MAQLKRSKSKKNHSESWAVSYVDMLTLLLCFFVIFFNQDEIVEDRKVSTIEMIASSFKGVNAQTGKDTDRRPQSVGTAVDPDMKKTKNVLQKIRLEEGWKITAKRKSLYVDFPGVSFFDTGETRLNEKGIAAIKRVLDLLEPFKGRVKVTIQGHTDIRRFGAPRASVADNWELSVLRATSSLKHFIGAGWSAHTVSAAGFADSVSKLNPKQSLSEQRKITLKVEEYEHEKI